MEELQNELAEKRSLATEVERRQGDTERLKKRLEDLLDREIALRAELRSVRRPEIVAVGVVDRIPERAPKYSIIGEVKNPGSYELLDKRTVMTAIAAAGGFTEYTNEKGVVVISNPKRSPKSHRFDLLAIMKGESPDEFLLQRGDIVWLPRKTVLR
jgi:protein involved in polysaccharide export with SLBB domain